jgi:hypothetical protein
MAVTISATQLALNRRDEFMLLVWVGVVEFEATKSRQQSHRDYVSSNSIPFLKNVS